MEKDIVKLADEIATKAHDGQTDRAGLPYITHPRTVASFVEGEKEKCVALLHDVIEDTDVTEKQLRELFDDEIVDAVCLLTHDESVDYFDYVSCIKFNELAKTVKLADLKHNSDISRIPNPTKKDYERLEKYEKAKEILLAD